MHLRLHTRSALLATVLFGLLLGLLVMPHTGHRDLIVGASAEHPMSPRSGSSTAQTPADSPPAATLTDSSSATFSLVRPLSATRQLQPEPAGLAANHAPTPVGAAVLGCLAILLSAALHSLWQASRSVGRRRPRLRVILPARTATRPAGPDPPRLLLARLCVLRI